MASVWLHPLSFHDLKQANYHYKTIVTETYEAFLFSTLHSQQELSEIHIAQVLSLALLSGYSLCTWCSGAGFLV